MVEELGGVSRETFRKAVAAEGLNLGTPFEPVYRSKMFGYDPVRTSIACGLPAGTLNYREQRLPVTERISTEVGVLFTHTLLLGTREDMELIAAAIRKVASDVDGLRQVEAQSAN